MSFKKTFSITTAAVCSIILTNQNLYSNTSLVDRHYIKNNMLREAPYHDSHGAKSPYLGAGMFYYGMIYANRSQVCVCIGSGGGFVPRIMLQAQKDAGVVNPRTILIDGNVGDFGRPLWLAEHSFFKRRFPEVEIMISLSHDASIKLQGELEIDYLHIDADHSEAGCMQDYIDFLPLVKKGGIITIHDTGNPEGGPAKVVKRIKEMGHDIIDFPNLGTGFAIVKVR